jgi:transposase InsO family protein
MSKMKTDLFTERKLAVMQLRQGKTMTEVARSLNRSLGWVSKWNRRYAEGSWTGLKEKSRAPIQHGNQLTSAIKEAVCQARLELEAEAELGVGLKYIGGQAIRTRLRQKKVTPLPSVATIERVIRQAGLTRPKAKPNKPEITYPRLHPRQPHQLCQVDIVPHFLQGGQRIASFNAIDVVSRYPTGRSYEQRRSQDAVDFLIHVWQELGIPQYTQVDNEGCFSGGATHPHVLGKVVRLALTVGTELVFSPVNHPQSNGTVERFHQDYNQHVWQDTYLKDLTAVNQQAQSFFALYQQREDHRQLHDQTPAKLHHQYQPEELAADFQLSDQKLPLREGRIHFMRRVESQGTVRILNANWSVPHFDPTKGVWVTIEFKPEGATLSIYDEAPDVSHRRCLVSYPFPLKESVLPAMAVEPICESMDEQQVTCSQAVHPPTAQLLPQSTSSLHHAVEVGEWLMLASISRTARLVRHLIFTMY